MRIPAVSTIATTAKAITSVVPRSGCEPTSRQAAAADERDALERRLQAPPPAGARGESTCAE